MCNTKTRWNTSKELTSEGHLTGESELRVISLKTNNNEDSLRFNIEILSWDLLVEILSWDLLVEILVEILSWDLLVEFFSWDFKLRFLVEIFWLRFFSWDFLSWDFLDFSWDF